MKKAKKIIAAATVVAIVVLPLEVSAGTAEEKTQTEEVFSVCKNLWEDIELKTYKMSHSEMFGDASNPADTESHYEDVIKDIYSQDIKNFSELSMGDEVTVNAYILQTIQIPAEQEWQINCIKKSGAYRVEIAMDNGITYTNYDEFSMMIRSNDPSVMKFQAGEYVTINGILLNPDEISSQDYIYDCSITKCEDVQAVPIGKENALKAARNYLDVMPFSHDGLVRQLISFDKYSQDEAEYAADYCGASWIRQAEKSAENYLKYMSFSKDGLIQQLELFDEYSKEQAEYAVYKVGY